MEIKLDDFARVSAMLRQLGQRAEATVIEEQMLKLAATALLFALTQHLEEFKRFMVDLDQPLTDQQKLYLETLGLEEKA